MQFPLAIFGAAIASVALAHLSEKAGTSRMDSYKETYNLSLRLMGFVLLPATVGLCILSMPIVQTLFEHGKFTHKESLLTHSALFYSTLGLMAHGINKVSAAAFYSLKDTVTPVKITFLQVLIDAVLCVILMGPMGVGGLTLASSISAGLSSAVFIILLRKKTSGIALSKTVFQYLKFILASAVMGAICLALKNRLEPSLSAPLLVAAVLPAGIISYALMAVILKMEERKIVWNLIRRR